MTPTELAKKLFEAYNTHGPNPWKTFDNRDVPRWDGLNDQVRGKWEAAAGEALRIFATPLAVAPAVIVPPPPEPKKK